MDNALITSPAGVMAVLVAVVSFWFWLERKSGWKVFNYLPPLIFIYATPVVLSNSHKIKGLTLPVNLVMERYASGRNG